MEARSLLKTGSKVEWLPFSLCLPDARPEVPRALETPEGVGDRLRSAAFAEIQAREAFRWAAGRFEDAPPACREDWLKLSREEDLHLGWLLKRLEELDQDIRARAVSTRLWQSLVSTPDAKTFAHFMAGSELRGREAGLSFAKGLGRSDPASADIFRTIANEELAHIALARKHF